ncbi:MAG: hypothetical protein EBY21_03540 [Alphaproteobacteria bacterium]|nr:hypothetical protein [Alphaproteobacteria bacterium]
MRILKTSDYIEAVLYDYNQGLSTILNADILLIRSPIRMGLDDLIRIEIDALTNGEDEKRNRLAVLIETTGGYIEVVERIYRVFRKHYKEVDFIVPNYAYSAGTVLVMSGDNIYMDYYSVLGPIDPQMENSDGQLVPGLGYLAKFDELMRAINNAKTGETRTAELAYLIKKFDPALLFSLEQAKEHSVKLLEEWLPRHKFKNW